MARKRNKDKATEVIQLWQRANGEYRQRWERVQQQGHDFFLNDQLTEKDKNALEESGMPSFIINRITPAIEMMKFFVTAKNPRWQAVGVDESDIDIAAVHSDIAAYAWDLSGGKSIFSQVILDALTKGIGYFLVDVDPDMDRGMGEVVFKRIEPFDVYVDPMSRELNFGDASYIIIKKDLPRQQLMRMFPEFARKIKTSSGSVNTNRSLSQRDITESDSIQAGDIFDAYKPDGEQDDILDYYECYMKEKLPFYSVFVVVPPDEAQIRQAEQKAEMAVSDLAKEMEVRTKERILEIQQASENGEIIKERAILEIDKVQKEAQSAVQQQRQEILQKLIKEMTVTENRVVSEKEFQILKQSKTIGQHIENFVKFYKTRIRLRTVVGEKELFDIYLENEEYPIVAVPYTYTGSPYPMSAVTPLVGKQQEINKSHQLMLHNANLASNLRWMYEEGALDEDQWEQYSSAPGALLKYRQGFTVPTPISPAPLNSAFYTITEQGKGDIEYMSGVPGTLQGDTSQQHETYRGLLAQDEYGTRRIKSWMQTVVEPCLEHLGKVFKEVAQMTYTSQKVFRIVQPGAGDENFEERSVVINQPIYNDFGNAIKKWNDYASCKFDVRYISGSTMPVNRWALLEEYFRWYQAGLIDDIAMLSETDVRNKEAIIKRKSIYVQLKNQVDQLNEELKDRDGTIETLSRQVIQSGIKDKINVADNEIRKDLLDTEAEQKYMRRLISDEIKEAKKKE
jgi:hypothetical protein